MDWDSLVKEISDIYTETNLCYTFPHNRSFVSDNRKRKADMDKMEFIEIKFHESDTTQKRLIKATKALIAAYGYAAMTTRMIANTAQVTLSAINFHFGSKENLVKAAMEDAAENFVQGYADLSNEIIAFLETKPVDKEKAWEYLDRFLADRIHKIFHTKSSWINIGIAEHESGLPESSRGILAAKVVELNEKVLYELIMAVSDRPDELKSALLSRTINASMMTFIEKRFLSDALSKSIGVDLNDLNRIQHILHDQFLRNIETEVIINPYRKRI